VRQITDVAGLVTEIAASTQEQSTGLHQINTAVNQMDQMTQQNAAMVEETNASSHSLASDAAELARLVSHFKIGVDSGAGRIAAPRRAA
jgi:methyl-accepting chemotaxis protein